MTEKRDEYLSSPPPPKRKKKDHDNDVAVMIGFVPVDTHHAARLRKSCTQIDVVRSSSDFIWRMTMGDMTKECIHWYSIMARSMLRMVRCLPQGCRANSTLVALTQELFGITEPGDLSFLKEYDFGHISTYTKMWLSINIAITLILVFVRDDHRGSMTGSSFIDREARKNIAKTAFFFISLHYDISIIRLLLDTGTGVNFFDKTNILSYIRTSLYGSIVHYINGAGGTTDTALFVAECISSYASVTNIDPFARVSQHLRPTEDASVVHKRYKQQNNPKPGNSEGRVRCNIIGYNPTAK